MNWYTLQVTTVDNAIFAILYKKCYSTHIMETKKPGRVAKNQHIYKKVRSMKKGAKWVVMNKEWELQAPPTAYVVGKNSGRKVSVRTLIDGSGWVITAL